MISVIMLTYNRESMVGRAIESILNQTYRDFEYIIVDNGSDDRSGEIADAYAAKDPRIKVLHIEKSNIGTGRNIGLDAATGEETTYGQKLMDSSDRHDRTADKCRYDCQQPGKCKHHRLQNTGE